MIMRQVHEGTAQQFRILHSSGMRFWRLDKRIHDSKVPLGLIACRRRGWNQVRPGIPVVYQGFHDDIGTQIELLRHTLASTGRVGKKRRAHKQTISPRLASDLLAASSMRTTLNPAQPSLNGFLFLLMHSTKYPS